MSAVEARKALARRVDRMRLLSTLAVEVVAESEVRKQFSLALSQLALMPAAARVVAEAASHAIALGGPMDMRLLNLLACKLVLSRTMRSKSSLLWRRLWLWQWLWPWL